MSKHTIVVGPVQHLHHVLSVQSAIFGEILSQLDRFNQEVIGSPTFAEEERKCSAADKARYGAYTFPVDDAGDFSIFITNMFCKPLSGWAKTNVS
jgi:hypothetical protein